MPWVWEAWPMNLVHTSVCKFEENRGTDLESDYWCGSQIWKMSDSL
jgi:hypothetical protein